MESRTTMTKPADSLEDWEYFQNEPDSVRNLILSFLTSKCEVAFTVGSFEAHQRECEKYHSPPERRRKPFQDGKLIYSPEQCEESSCKLNDTCTMSHTKNEVMYHPAKYRTQMCSDTSCVINNKFCPYAHSKDQLRNGAFYAKNPLNMKMFTFDFDLMSFKTKKCEMTAKHNEKQCLCFHSDIDRRRHFLLYGYAADRCVTMENEKYCQNGDQCKFSHNKVEEFYHPAKFKSKFCSHFSFDDPSLIRMCSYGPYCSFAHSDSEIQIDLIHRHSRNEEFFIYYFKTVLCPFTQSHDKASCVYSHNWQDFRRNPLKFTYKNHSCPKWSNKKIILNYKDGCPEEMACLLCHGWKEEDFHPLNYKTKKCKNFYKDCTKGDHCPFFHESEGKRTASKTIIDDYELKLKGIKKKKIKRKPKKGGTLHDKSIFSSGKKNSDVMLSCKSINVAASLIDNTEGNDDVGKLPILPPMQQKNNSFTFTKKRAQKGMLSFSSNSSFNSLNISDNENEKMNSSHKHHYSNYSQYSSPNSNSSSENFTESFANEGGVLINPDDSIEFCKIGENNNNNKREHQVASNKPIGEGDSNNNNILEIEYTNLKLKNLLDSLNIDSITGNVQCGALQGTSSLKSQMSTDEFMNYLLVNNFKMLYEKLKSKEIDIKALIDLNDDEIFRNLEAENMSKFPELRETLMRVEDQMDGEDLLKIIDDKLIKADECNLYCNEDEYS